MKLIQSMIWSVIPAFAFSASHTEKPKTQPQTSDCQEIGMFVTADYLYWKAQEDQLVYANLLESVPALGPPSRITIIEQDFEWSSGCKVGAGYRHPSQLWSVYFNWTHFHNETSGSISSPSRLLFATNLTAALNITAGFIVTVDGATSTWHLKMDMMDLEFGRLLPFGNGFYLTPHFGVKGGWINQTQTINYSNFTSNVAVFTSSNATVLKTNNCAAIGPRFGFNSGWAGKVIGGGQGPCSKWDATLGIFGNLSAALLYSDFHVSDKFNFQSTPPLQNGTIADDKFQLRPTMQLALGVDWTQKYKRCWGFAVRASYEAQYWWNQWQVTNNTLSTLFLNQSTTDGDLTFQGLTVEFAFLF
jgi:hypothetical protein